MLKQPDHLRNHLDRLLFHNLTEREASETEKGMMKILFSNIRGMGASGRCNQLRELRYKHKVDVICLQETIKQNFTKSLLECGAILRVGWNFVAGTLFVKTGNSSFVLALIKVEPSGFFQKKVLRNSLLRGVKPRT
jgi:hypothetical protein